ncbi:Uncharacterised protein [Neisseria meningitidis]|nr:Uncharacterised protein [Neisseria meningitidis]
MQGFDVFQLVLGHGLGAVVRDTQGAGGFGNGGFAVAAEDVQGQVFACQLPHRLRRAVFQGVGQVEHGLETALTAEVNRAAAAFCLRFFT